MARPDLSVRFLLTCSRDTPVNIVMLPSKSGPLVKKERPNHCAMGSNENRGRYHNACFLVELLASLVHEGLAKSYPCWVLELMSPSEA